MNTDLSLFNELQTQLTTYFSPVKDIVISDLETSKSVSSAFRELKGLDKKIDAKVKELCEPLKREMDRIKAFGEQVKQPVLAAIKDVSNKQLAYEEVLKSERIKQYQAEQEMQRKRDAEARAAMLAQQKEAEEKARAIREEAETNAMFSAPDDAAEVIANAEKEAAKAKANANAESARIAFEAKSQHWEAKKEIKEQKVAGVRRSWKGDIIDESIIPDEYMMKIPNEKKIKNAITHMEIREIPGVRIYEDVTLTTR
jgi:hypothetical protein